MTTCRILGGNCNRCLHEGDETTEGCAAGFARGKPIASSLEKTKLVLSEKFNDDNKVKYHKIIKISRNEKINHDSKVSNNDCRSNIYIYSKINKYI